MTRKQQRFLAAIETVIERHARRIGFSRADCIFHPSWMVGHTADREEWRAWQDKCVRFMSALNSELLEVADAYASDTNEEDALEWASSPMLDDESIQKVKERNLAETKEAIAGFVWQDLLSEDRDVWASASWRLDFLKVRCTGSDELQKQLADAAKAAGVEL